MKSKREVERFIENNITDVFKQDLKEQIRASISCKVVSAKPKVGASKFGGIPDLPKGVNWSKSKYSKLPYSFLAQINLNEVVNFDVEQVLPNFGMLYFFFDLDSGDDGFCFYADSKELYQPSIPIHLQDEPPTFFQKLFKRKKQSKVLTEKSMQFDSFYNFPASWFDLNVQDAANTNNEDFYKVLEQVTVKDEDFYFDENHGVHQLLGWYNGIQNNLLELDFNESTRMKDMNELTSDEIKEALKWKLLFVFSSDKALDYNLMDGGVVYFFIHEDDLKQGNFNNVQVIAETC